MGGLRRNLLVLFLALCAGATGPAVAEGAPGPMQIARQAMTRGALDAAIAAGAQAYRAARTDAQRLAAARLVAAAHFRAGQPLRAELWLRRAADAARTEAEIAALREDFAALRAASPWAWTAQAWLGPNSNINNGSQARQVSLWGLPFQLAPDARALAGTELALGFSAAYRLGQSQNHLTELGLSGSANVFALSPASRRAAPNVDAADYSFAAIEAFAGHAWRHDLASGPARASLTLGRNWYGGDPYTLYQRAGLSQEWTPAEGRALRLGLSREWIDQQGSGIFARTDAVQLDWSGDMSRGRALSLSLGHKVTSSADIFTAGRATSLGGRYDLGPVLPGLELGLDVILEQRRWRFSLYGPDGRRDHGIVAGADLTFSNMTRFGYMPVLRLEARQNRSNIDLYDRNSVGVRLGIVSAY